MSDVRFCWICSNKLYGNSKEILLIDGHPRTLHKQCAKQVKNGYDYIEKNDGWHSLNWELSGSFRD